MPKSEALSHSLDCLVLNMDVEIQQKASEAHDGRVVVGIGGYSSLGKGTLADGLAQFTKQAAVVPVDSFILDRETKRRLGLTGDEPYAIQFDELTKAVRNLRRGKPVLIRPYDHTIGAFQEQIELAPQPFIIVEGTGSLYPPLVPFLDLSYFMNADPKTLDQIARAEYLSKRRYSEDEFNKFWAFYKRSCDLFITPSMKNAQTIIDVSIDRRYRSTLIRICNE